MVTVPESGFVIPPMISASVDLPLPVLPTTAVMFFVSETVIPFSAGAFPSGVTYEKYISVRLIIFCLPYQALPLSFPQDHAR